MMAWTKEQLDAINREGNNIIVSAGAGSGKTAVLTERVLRKVKEGVHINELLIMTFTNAAAKEMKDRIRKKLKKENLKEELNLIDSAYITTFDSFSLSIVKKYHYLLNLPKNISITDNSLLSIEKSKLMDEMFDEYYLEDSLEFKKFIKNFCYKDDSKLKKLLIQLNDKLDMKIDKKSYLEQYVSSFYDSDKIQHDILLFYQEIKEKINYMKDLVDELSLHMDGDYIAKLYDVSGQFFDSKCYDDVVRSMDFSFPRLPNCTDSSIKCIKEKLSSIHTEIKKMCVYENEKQMKDEILSTKSTVEVIITILKNFDQRFTKYKLKNNMFSFHDISKMAIDIVKDNVDVRNELKEQFQEIMVDEYQDTNDIQEYFISFISKNNVYMVGDIKQSIYRFRNANPYIFKNKYDLYSKGEQGIKIDLVKNFRSREEVLNNINLVFRYLMDENLGGANYKESHQMVFGNIAYHEEGKTDQEYNLELLSYNDEKDEFSNTEKEIFIIAEDIKKKIENHYQIFDKDDKVLRDVVYDDFVILIDRTKDFELYKKIFEYLGIPLTLYKDEEIKSDSDILIIRNILRIEKAIDREEFKEEFKYAFLSLGRSFLFDIEDSELLHIFHTNGFKQSIIYKKCEELYQYYYEVTPKMFFLKLLEIFNYEENLLKLNNIKTSRVRLEYFYNLLDQFEQDGKLLEEFVEYLDLIFESDEKTTFTLHNSISNSVKIMTIHKSKGLEYPICYFAGFSKEFSFKELNDPILYSNRFGMITPYFNDYQKDTIYKTLLKLDVKKEELSERIRLLYVALTRAEEKMMIVIPKIHKEDVGEDMSIYNKKKITSFFDMIQFVYFYLEDYVKEMKAEYTKDYLINQSNLDYDNLKDIDHLKIEEPHLIREELKEEHFSKNQIQLITKEQREKMEFGTKIHEKLEFLDFKHPDYTSMTDFERNKIESFIHTSLIQENLDSKIYKEFEFTYQEEGCLKHGIIDLMIENDTKIILIDYKLKNVTDAAYLEQLYGYQKYISRCTDKSVEIYLYSILDSKFVDLNTKKVSLI